MNQPGKQCNRRGRSWQKTMLRCLRLMNQYKRGEHMEAEEAMLAKTLLSKLTPLQETYLRLYYGSVLTQDQIGKLLGCNLSSVSRGLNRAEDNVDRILADLNLKS